jgi:hypothetical protein
MDPDIEQAQKILQLAEENQELREKVERYEKAFDGARELLNLLGIKTSGIHQGESE